MTAVRPTIAGLLLGLAVVGCGDGPSEDAGLLEVRAVDPAFEVPRSVPAGRVTLRLQNDGTFDHQALLVRFHDGEDVDSYLAANEDDPSGLSEAELVDFVGGVNGVEPGEAAEVVQDLVPGNYAVICFIQEHFKSGMFEPFEVTGDMPETEPLGGDGTLALTEFAFDVPAVMAAGDSTVLVRNDGSQVHEATLLRLDGGTDETAFLEAATGDGLFPDDDVTSVGGVGGLEPGSTARMELRLPAGTYALVCFFPDPESRRAHVSQGMASVFEVT